MNLTDSAHFFIVYPIDLEDLGLIELNEKFKLHFAESSFSVISQVPGGIEIECPLKVGLLLNQILRCPTRILLRLSEFKCRDFPKLYQKISKFNWAPWMLGQTPEVVCASKNSRLFDSRKIEKAIQDGINQYYRHKPVKKKYLIHYEATNAESLPKLYFRSVDDLVTLSIDTTGERLHLRGDKTLAGLAPIRENLGALLLLSLRSHLSSSKITLIDPMCGSGTFLIEAKNSYALTFSRDFSFLHLPVVLDAPAFTQELKEIKNDFLLGTVGFDISRDVITQAKKNDPEGVFQVEDLMNSSVHNYSHPVVIMNPPYGIRVGENINLDFFLRVIRKCKEKFHPELLGIIIPGDFKIYSNNEFSVLASRPFKNGGIDVVFYVLEYK